MLKAHPLWTDLFASGLQTGLTNIGIHRGSEFVGWVYMFAL